MCFQECGTIVILISFLQLSATFINSYYALISPSVSYAIMYKTSVTDNTPLSSGCEGAGM